jgi:hypothetical protein
MKKFGWVLVPIELGGVLVYTQMRAASIGSVPPGGECATTVECSQAAPICSITDKGFWIFGIKGYCTGPCELGRHASCPPGLECRDGSVTFSQGTRWNRQWIEQAGAFCAKGP